MKKLSSAILFALSSSVLIGCGGGSDTPAPTPVKPTTPPLEVIPPTVILPSDSTVDLDVDKLPSIGVDTTNLLIADKLNMDLKHVEYVCNTGVYECSISVDDVHLKGTNVDWNVTKGILNHRSQISNVKGGYGYNADLYEAAVAKYSLDNKVAGEVINFSYEYQKDVALIESTHKLDMDLFLSTATVEFTNSVMVQVATAHKTKRDTYYFKGESVQKYVREMLENAYNLGLNVQ